MTILGLLGAGLHLLPERFERPLLYATLWTLGLGLFSEILINILRNINAPRQILSVFFGTNGITPIAAIIVFAITFFFYLWWESHGSANYKARAASRTDEQKKRNRLLVLITSAIFVLLMPWILGIYLTEVLDIVGIFILMGLGLNIVVGYAGLLDLGYVAFFAIGAYMMGLLTTTGDLSIAGLSFWAALPIAVGTATLAGIILGIPVLRMRGDYLAIVTLGFGEIIRVLAVSDLLKGTIGGAQGVLSIGKPQILSFTFVEPRHFYYLILAGVMLALFVSSRLRDARLGRQWMAMREDEDVAEAMGIRLVNTKLLAFAMGATFSGLAGAIFASRIGSIFPSSFNLLISINVLSLIIVGGLGSLPGVILGAFVLVGLPELLREFSEYRLLFYGILLIATMLLRPEGLWPSPIRKRELHAELDDFDEGENQPDVHYMA
jgi:branched-chain amino acid transport system permease protein